MKIFKTHALLLNLAYILQSNAETDQTSPGTHEALSLDCKRQKSDDHSKRHHDSTPAHLANLPPFSIARQRHEYKCRLHGNVV